MEPLISIVDDDQAVREALQRMLRSYGFTTAVFASAEQFLASGQPVRRSLPDPRCPHAGNDRHWRCTASGCRGLPNPDNFDNSVPDERRAGTGYAMGVVSYLAKPFDEHVLLETVREALEHGSQAAD